MFISDNKKYASELTLTLCETKKQAQLLDIAYAHTMRELNKDLDKPLFPEITEDSIYFKNILKEYGCKTKEEFIKRFYKND